MQPANAHKRSNLQTARGDWGSHLSVIDARASRRRRARTRKPYRTPKRVVSAEVRRFDPMSKREHIDHQPVVIGAGYLFFALLLHGAVLITLVRFGDGEPRLAVPKQKETVVVRMTEPKLEKPSTAPEPIPLDEPAPEVNKKPVTKAPVKEAKRRPAMETPEPAAADPVNVAQAPQENTSPRRRVVGISFESTVKGGKGPSFAVGNTRMGETGDRAFGASGLSALPRGRTSGKASSPNRVATNIPTAGVTLTKPKRLSALEPEYPSLLKAQGVEGNVVVLVTIDEKGRVNKVRIVKGSGYEALDSSAKNAATKERFSPAKRNGEPIAYTLKYTYRFRVRQS